MITGPKSIFATTVGESILLNPQDPHPYYNRGATYANIGQYERAIEDIDEAIRIDSQNPYFYQMRGQFNQALGRDSAGARDFQKAIGLGYTP